ncbi:MAG: hypothetical protein M1831_005417 [Alyxoria varia]|nr:MAG: hypothetical protein M1831_005417 [Alyxoria varia]
MVDGVDGVGGGDEDEEQEEEEEEEDEEEKEDDDDSDEKQDQEKEDQDQEIYNKQHSAQTLTVKHITSTTSPSADTNTQTHKTPTHLSSILQWKSCIASLPSPIRRD